MKPLILASASPRRANLLRMLGLSFEVVPSRVSESLDSLLEPADHVLEISRRKAVAVARKYPDALVLGADTVVTLDGDIIEKPADRAEAARMLGRLSGQTHRVYTGLTLIDTGVDRSLSDVAATSVTIRKLSPREIDWYVETQEPLDKAGAYAAQGRAAVFIESVSGCFYNVVGLPLALFWEMMGRMIGNTPWSRMAQTAVTTDLISPDQPGF